MRVLADENIPACAVEMLSERGHDVHWVRVDARGAADRDVLALGVAQNRVLLTFDKDFGELVFRSGLPASCGIVLFRIVLPSPSEVGERIVTVLESRTDWTGAFAVVEKDRVRMIKLPPEDKRGR